MHEFRHLYKQVKHVIINKLMNMNDFCVVNHIDTIYRPVSFNSLHPYAFLTNIVEGGALEPPK